MEDREIGPDLRAWFSVGYEVIFLPGLCSPRLLLLNGCAPVAVLPADGVAYSWERMIAWCIVELVQSRVGWEGMATKLAEYAYVAA